MTLIKNITPKTNTFNFPVDGQIDIEFIKAMDKDSLLREDAVYLEKINNARVPIARVPVERKVGTGRQLSLIPIENLEHGTFYTITFNGYDGGIEDWSKAPLNAEEVTDFLTEFAISEDDSPSQENPPDDNEDPDEGEDPGETSPPEQPEDPSVNPNPPIDDDFNEGVVSSSIYLEKAYPDNGKVLNTDSPIVLIFSEELEPGDVQKSVKLTHLGLEEDIEIPVSNIRKSRSNRHVITYTATLEEGEDYVLTIGAGLSSGDVMLEEDITLRYKANWSHMYTSIEDVRLLLGDFGDALTDEDIARLIHNQSKSIHQLMQGMEVYVPEEWVNQFPYAAGQYVFPGGRSCYNSVTGSADRSCPSCYGLGYVTSIRKYRTRERDLSINESRPTSRGSLSFGELAIENKAYYFYKDVPIKEQDIIIEVKWEGEQPRYDGGDIYEVSHVDEHRYINGEVAYYKTTMKSQPVLKNIRGIQVVKKANETLYQLAER